ncbi:MAG TPA: VWA domain-containing protein [Candidatus Binatia bacterium]|nr:VWA domain-containing protein [Candidatus Binatia bacterium]
MTRCCFTIVLLLWLAAAAASAPAQEQPSYRTQANVVLVPALVRDRSGDVVYGLRADDFIVEDEGVPQRVLLDEAAGSEPVSLVVAIQCGRRADFELPRMRGLGAMLLPLLAQPGTKIAIVAFDSQVHAIGNFTGDAQAIAGDLAALQPGDGGAAVLDAVDYSARLLDTVPEGHKRVLLLISETRDHGSRSANIGEVIRAIGNSNIVVYTLAFSPSKSNVLDTLRGNNNPDLHPEQTEVHESPDLLAPFVLAAQAMRRNTARAIASQTGGEYHMFDSAKGFDAHMTEFANHLHSRYLLSFQPVRPHPGLHRIEVLLKQSRQRTVLARGSYWAVGAEQ